MKNRISRLLALLLSVCFAIAAFPTVTLAEEETALPSISLLPGEVEFWVDFGSPCELRTVTENAPANSVVRYTSSDTAIVTVSDTGNLTPVSKGTAYVTARLTDSTGETVYATSAPVTVRVVDNPITIPEGSDPDNQLLTLGSTSTPRINTNEYLAWPSAYGDAHVTLWKDGRVGAFTMTVDDNIAGDFAKWTSWLEQYGLPTTFMVPTRGYTESAPVWNYYLALGQGVQSHSRSHPSDTVYNQMSTAQVWMDFYLGYKDITQYTDTRSMVIGYSYGWNNPVYSSKIYIAGRGTYGAVNSAATVNYNQTGSLSGLSDNYMNHLDAITTGNNKGGWCSVHWHGINSSSAVLLEQIFASLYDLSEQRLLWVDLFANVAMYGQERDTSTLTVTSTGANSISFTLTDRMNDLLYDFPLTVAIRVDDTWQAAAATQGGREIEVEVLEKDGATYLMVQAVPDRGAVTVRRMAVEDLSQSEGLISLVPADLSGTGADVQKTFTFPVDDTWQHAWAVQDDQILETECYTFAQQRYVKVTGTPGGGRIVLCREDADSDRQTAPVCTVTDMVNGKVTPTSAQTVTVSSIEELDALARYVNAGHDCAGVHFALTCDLDFDGAPLPHVIGRMMMGESSSGLRFYYPFSGTFDGCGYSISNIAYEQDTCGSGLFGYTQDATIRNLHVSGTYAGIKWVGGIVGYMSGGTLENCTFTGSLSSAGFSQRNSGANTGGLVGSLSGGTVSGCTANATISVTAGSGANSGNYAGGLVGGANGAAVIKGCHFTGSVTATPTADGAGARYIGGLVGGGDQFILRDCAAYATVSGSQYVGGITGHITSTGSYYSVYNCMAQGAVSGSTYVGGIAGYMGPSNRAKCINCLVDVDVSADEDGIAGVLFGAINAANNNPAPSYLYYPAGSDSTLPLFVAQGTKGASAKTFAYTQAHLDGTATAPLVSDDDHTITAYGKTSLREALNGWVEAKASDGYGTWTQTGDALPTPLHLSFVSPGFTPDTRTDVSGPAFRAALQGLSAESSAYGNFLAFDTAYTLLFKIEPTAADIDTILWFTRTVLAYNSRVADVSSAARKMAELQLLLSGCALREEPLYAMAHEQLSQEGN